MQILNSFVSQDKSAVVVVVGAAYCVLRKIVLSKLPIDSRHINAGKHLLRYMGLNPSDYRLIDVVAVPLGYGFQGPQEQIEYSFERIQQAE